MTSPFCDAHGATIPDEQILGGGGSAVVILRDGVAVKTPLRALWSTEYEIQANIDSLRREQDVYRRLQPASAPHDGCDARSRGVVRCLKLAPDAIHLAHMPHGNMQAYLATSKQPSWARQLQWCIEMAQALNYIHDRCVLVADIASRNVLVGADLSVKLCDFSEASLLPLGTDMRAADDNGYTVKMDIGLLGAVMYEVATGSIECKVDLYSRRGARCLTRTASPLAILWTGGGKAAFAMQASCRGLWRLSAAHRQVPMASCVIPNSEPR